MVDNRGNNAPVRDCTLEDIDAVCLDFQRFELAGIIKGNISNYFKDSFGASIEDGSCSHQDWFSCTLSHSQECLSPTAVNYIRDQISL